MIRKKVLYRCRLLDHYFLIAIDGTGMLTFPERHCPHCLTCTRNGKTIYYHPVLEAKLVTPDGLVFSIMTEFIENPGENPAKQDCELKAFYRLAERLKKRFPRLPICLLLDGLFAGGPTFALCEKNNWKYFVVLQEDDLPSVHEEFELLRPLAPENHLRFHTGVQLEIQQDFRWMNDISYVDSERREHTISVLECLETRPDSKGERKTTRFKWITNLNVKTNNVITLGNEGGRLRWKIENEGFNVQKNGGFALEHAYTRNATASKVFYYRSAELTTKPDASCTHRLPTGRERPPVSQSLPCRGGVGQEHCLSPARSLAQPALKPRWHPTNAEHPPPNPIRSSLVHPLLVPVRIPLQPHHPFLTSFVGPSWPETPRACSLLPAHSDQLSSST